jgi:hypothetical protein
MVPVERETSLMYPSVPPTATTELAGLMDREVKEPVSKRESKLAGGAVRMTLGGEFPGYAAGLRGPTN